MKLPFGFQVALFLVAWCAMLELLVRAVLVSPSNIVPDSALGAMYQPNSSALVEIPDVGFGRISVNELGLNDGTIAPKGQRHRILVLGDSYVEAFQVPRTENFLGLLERSDPRFQLVNGGKSGLDPTTELVMLRKLAPVLHPDGVILVVNAGDRDDLLADGIRVRRCGDPARVCRYRAPPPTVIGALQWRIVRTYDRSALLTYLSRRFHNPVLQMAGVVRVWINPSASHKPEPAPNTYTAGDFEPLLRLVFLQIEQDYPLLVVAVPDIDFQPNGKSVSADNGTFERDVKNAAASAGAAYVDAGPALEAAYARDRQPPRGFDFHAPGGGHLNKAGHAALARAIESKLGIFSGARTE